MKLLILHQRSELYERMLDYCRESADPCFHELEIEYFADRNYDIVNNYETYVQTNEHQGPEWVEPDPEFLERVATADILMVEWGAVNRKVIDAGKNLKLICTVRSAPENIDVEYACSKGIKVSICPSRLGNAVADMVVAMMLSECRGLLRRNLVYTKGQWVLEKYNDDSHAVLGNLKVGLVGYGGIARIVAKRLIHGFDCEVYAYEKITSPEVIAADGVKQVDLDTLCRTCDVISMHARLVPETENMFGREQFALMKPNAIFINTARAGLVDQDAMIDALVNHKIRGAGLDVYPVEPLPEDYPLLKLDNVTLMPHSAGASGDIIKNSVKIISAELRRFLTGQALECSVTKNSKRV